MREVMICRAESSWGDGRFAYPGTLAQYAPDRTFDIRHLKLEIALDFSKKTLRGRCRSTLEALADGVDTMEFDAVNFKEVRVSAAGKSLRHTYNGRKIKIIWPKPFRHGAMAEVEIQYRVTQPKLGLHFVGPDRNYPNKPLQAWTQGEDEYNRYWFPSHDAPQERMTTEMIVTVPVPFTAISNGALLRVSRRGRLRTFHWKHKVPHPAYLVSLAVGEFSEIKDRWNRIPVLYYCPPGREEDAKRAFSKTPKMMEFYSKKLGVPYAYAKYSQVAAVDFIYGGMENTSCTTQTILTLHDARAHLDFSSDPLVAHELAHQWFGDLVTCKDWSHAWLNESFATYFEALFKEHDRGYDEFMVELRENAQIYLSEDRDRYRRPLSTKFFKNTNDLFDRHLYEKGSCILHMLRKTLGEKGWWRSMQVYLTRNRAQGVETINLIDAIQDATGRNMRPFFDQWVFKGGHPEFKVRTWWNEQEKKAYLRVLQTQAVTEETPLYNVPVDLSFWVGGKERRFAETIEKKDHLFVYALPQAPDFVLFDPEHTILKRLDFVKPECMWIAQLTQDPHPLGRMDAAEALGRIGSPAAFQALRQAFFEESFWAVQAEIARAIGRIRSLLTEEALLEGLRRLEHPKVRRALYEALGFRPSAKAAAEIRERLSSEKSYFAQSEALRVLGRTKDASLLGLFKEYLKTDSWNDVLRCAALDAIGSLQLAESISLLKEYCRYGHHPNVRMAAIRQLAARGREREDIQPFLIGLLDDRYLLVQLAVVRALAAFADERAAKPLMKFTMGDRDGRLKRAAEEAVRKIRKGMDQEFPQDDSSKAADRRRLQRRTS